MIKTIFKSAATEFSIDKKGIIDGKPTNFMEEGLNYVLFGPKTVNLYIDWLNTYHFDYHGLIEKGLALEAPEGMYN